MTKPRPRKPASFRYRFNKDGTVSLLTGGQVVYKSRDIQSLDTFIIGWRGAESETPEQRAAAIAR